MSSGIVWTRDLLLARVSRALGVAGYDPGECDEILRHLFSVGPAPVHSSDVEWELRVRCERCGSQVWFEPLSRGALVSRSVAPCGCGQRRVSVTDEAGEKVSGVIWPNGPSRLTFELTHRIR